MLVLTRKEGERIRIAVPGSAEPIWITLVRIEPGHERVRLGFEAPESVRIDREEMHRHRGPGRDQWLYG